MAPEGDVSGKGHGQGQVPPHGLVFQGIRWPSHVRSEEQLAAFRALPGRPDDVFVATYPKCGTHWVHKLCSLILDVDTFMFPTEFNPWEKGAAWAGKGAGKGDLPHADLPSPRILATHAPFDMLPGDVHKMSCRIVYVVREPKDTLVSYYHFACSNPWIPTPTSFDDFADQFVAGADLDRAAALAGGASVGGFAPHVSDYVKAARSGANIHLMSYDRLSAQPHEEITALGKFLGVDLSPEVVEEIRQKGSFDSMKAAAAAKEAAGRGMITPDGRGWSDILWRKGSPGDGSSTLSKDMARRVDEAFGAAFSPMADVFSAQSPSPA